MMQYTGAMVTSLMVDGCEWSSPGVAKITSDVEEEAGGIRAVEEGVECHREDPITEWMWKDYHQLGAGKI